MQASPLRSVMDVAEYRRERARLQELYGDPEASSETLIAMRDQAFADLFHRSGWTQEQVAEQEGKSQPWVACRLRFARFINYVIGNNITTVIFITMTERSFRGYWERTDKDAHENARLDAVVHMMQAPRQETQPKERKVKAQPPSPKRERAREIVRPLVEAGAPIRSDKLHKEHGLSDVAFRVAAALEQGRIEGLREAAEQAPIDTSGLSASAQERFAALERRLRTSLEAEFRDRVSHEVRRHIDEYLMPAYKKQLEDAELLTKIGKPFTNAQFISLLRALHPDSTSAEYRHDAFILLKEKQIVLRPEEKDRPLTSSLPQTLAELMARREAVKRKANSANTRTKGRRDTDSAASSPP